MSKKKGNGTPWKNTPKRNESEYDVQGVKVSVKPLLDSTLEMKARMRSGGLPVTIGTASPLFPAKFRPIPSRVNPLNPPIPEVNDVKSAVFYLVAYYRQNDKEK